MKEKLLILILFLLLGGVFAVEEVDSIFSNPIIPLILAMLFTTIIIVISYILGKLFDSHFLNAWAKVEIGELVLSVVLIIIILGLVGIIDGFFDPSITFSPNETDAQTRIIEEQIEDTQNMIYKISKNFYHLSKYSTFSYRSTSSGWFSSEFTSQAQNPGLAPLSSVLNRLLNHLSQLIIILKTELILLDYLKIITFSILLPIGIFFRTFSPTKKIGTTLLALSVGFIVVFPMGILIGNYIYEALDPSALLNEFNIPDPGNPPDFDKVCSPAITAFAEIKEYGTWFTTCTPICASYAALACSGYAVTMPAAYSICIKQRFLSCWRPYVPFLVDSGWCWPIAETIYHWQLNAHQREYSNQLANYANLDETGINNVYTNIMETAINAVILQFLVIITIILFTIILTFGVIRSVAITLGGDVSFYGLTRLI